MRSRRVINGCYGKATLRMKATPETVKVRQEIVFPNRPTNNLKL